MKKLLKFGKLFIFILSSWFMFANTSFGQTPGSIAGFGSLGATIAGNQELAQHYTDQYTMTVREKPGCDGTDKCKPYCKYEPSETCFLCPVFALIFNTVSAVGDKAIKAFSSSVVKVVVVAFAIWLAIQILMFASSFETRDLKDLTQSIIAQGFLIVLVVVILQTGAANFFDAFINPVYETGQKMAQTMFDACGQQGQYIGENGLRKCATDNISAIEYQPSSFIRTDIDDGLPPSMGNSIIHTMTSMENHVKQFKAFGSGMACQSWKEGWFIFPKFVLLITGGAIWIFSMLIIVAVPFLMIDSVFQLGVAAALLPVAVGCFAFKSTRQYSKKVWETVLNSMFSFLFISVIVLMLMSILQVAVDSGVENISKAGNFASMFEDPETAANSTYFDTVIENFSWAHHGFLKLAFTFILAWAMIGMGKEFADEFASSISNTSIGSSIGTMAASSAKGMATKLGKPVAKAVGDKMVRGGINLTKRAVKLPGQAVKAAGRGISKLRMERNKARGGKAEYKDILGRTHKLLENGVEEITKTRRNGTSVKILRSKDMSIKTLESESGKVKTKITLNSNRLDRMISEDGKVNMKLRDKMLEGMSEKERKEFEKAIHMKVAEKRFGSNLHNSKSAMKNEPEVISQDENGMVIKIVTEKGDVVLIRSKINKNGYMESEMLKADKKGNVTTLSTDGMRNRMSSARLSDVNDLQKLENMGGADLADRKKDNGGDEKFNKLFDGLLEKDKEGNVKKKTNYSYSKKMQRQIDRGARPESIGFDENGNALGIMSMAEAVGEKVDNEWKPGAFAKFVGSNGNEFRKADMDINFNV